VLTQGQRTRLPLRGGASLDIVLYAPTHDLNGVPTYHPADPANLVNVIGFRTCYTTIGLGVRVRLVFTLSGPGDRSRMVIDVAHQW
jgi:hypothetical protein